MNEERVIPERPCCGNCAWWTHDSAMMDAIIGEEGYSVCGKLHPAVLYGKQVYIDIITPRQFCCQEWKIDDPVPVMTDEEIRALMEEDPEQGEDDDISDEEWKVLKESEANGK